MRMNKRKGDISDLLYLRVLETNLGDFLRTVDEPHKRISAQKGELHGDPTNDVKAYPDADVSGLMTEHRSSLDFSCWSDLVRESSEPWKQVLTVKITKTVKSKGD